MHLTKDYIAQVTLGDLQHLPLQNKPALHHKPAYTNEINQVGVYIHKLHYYGTTIEDQLKKIQSDEIPTPCTYVGVGAHRTYNHGRFENASGLVFSPAAISLLSYKGDIYSNRLSTQDNQKNLSSFTQPDRPLRCAEYAGHLSEAFNKLGSTASAFKNRRTKKLVLVEDVAFAKAKYRELEIRSNLAYRKEEDTPPSHMADQSSKYTIAQLLVSPSKPAGAWTKDELLEALQSQCDGNPGIASVLEHALLKIRRFDNDAAVRAYLQLGDKPPLKQDYYVEIIREWGAQTANEHLLMPAMEDICGICVNTGALFGIDQALAINAELMAREKAAGVKERKAPALVHQLSAKKGQSVIQLGWSQHVIPWSTEGLKAFAKTGAIEGINQSQFKPDHFRLIDKLADAAGLVFFDPEKKINQCKAEHNFVDDLSAVTEGESNLLHLTIQSKRNLDFIKLLFFWKVDAFSKKDAQNLTPLELAQISYPEAYEFLKEAQGWAGNNILTEKRNEYIKERLEAMHRGSGDYALRNGWSEKGAVSFVPELGTYRVTNGEHIHDSNPAARFSGVREFDNNYGDMALSIGFCKTAGRTTEVGLWKLLDPAKSSKSALRLGLAYDKAYAGPGGEIHCEEVRFVSTIADCNSVMHLKFNGESNGFQMIDVECSFQTIAEDNSPDRKSCGYVKAKLFVDTRVANHFREQSSNAKLPLMTFSRRNIDRQLKRGVQRLASCKIALANLRYLEAWKKNVVKMNPAEEAYLKDLDPDFENSIKAAMNEQMLVVASFVEHHALKLKNELIKVDDTGHSLAQEIGGRYVMSESPDDAVLQFTLGAILEQVTVGAVMAKDLYKKAARHQAAGATDALARLNASLPQAPTPDQQHVAGQTGALAQAVITASAVSSVNVVPQVPPSATAPPAQGNVGQSGQTARPVVLTPALPLANPIAQTKKTRLQRMMRKMRKFFS